MLVEVLLGLLILGIVLYQWLTWNHNYWKIHNIPSVEPELFFGNIRELIFMKKNMGQVYEEIYWKYPDEPAIGSFKFRQPQLVIKDSDLCKNVMIKEFNSFPDPAAYMSEKADPIVGRNPFFSRGERWKSLRAFHTPSVTTAKLKGMLPLLVNVGKDMIDFLEKKNGEPQEAKFLAGQFTTDAVSSVIFGISTNSFKDPNSQFRNMAKKVFELDFWSNFSFLSTTYFPWINELLRIRFLKKEIADFFTKVVTDTVIHRRKNNIKRNDLLQQIMETETDYEAITGHAMTFFFDAYETSAILISFVLKELGDKPEVQEKLKAEIKSHVKDLDNLDFETLHGLDYLSAVINETLRLYPPAFGLTRECQSDITLEFQGRKYPIKKGMNIAIPLYSIHRDPKYFEDPTTFNPERFYKNSNVPGFFPFGAGPRMCLGMRYALTQTKVSIISLLLNFDISPKEGAAEVEFETKSSILMVAKGGVWLKFNKSSS